jgi:hypothetical protein
MLGQKSGDAEILFDDFHNATVWHCDCHRLELGMSDAVDEVAGVNCLQLLYCMINCICYTTHFLKIKMN